MAVARLITNSTLVDCWNGKSHGLSTEAEVERLMAAAKRNRRGHRDATMVLGAYRHGLRASELVDQRFKDFWHN